MITEFETSFVVMPAQSNYMAPMIFGGAFFSEMDLCAACCADRLLLDSECNSAVTYKADVTFHAPTEVGDIIFLQAKVVELRWKAIVIEVKAYRSKRNSPERDFVAEVRFVFISRKDGQYCNHGLTLPSAA